MKKAPEITLTDQERLTLRRWSRGRGTPAIRNGRVFTHGAEGRLTCLDLLTGEVIWQRNTSVEFDAPQDFFGVASTPLVESDLLIVNVGPPADLVWWPSTPEPVKRSGRPEISGDRATPHRSPPWCAVGDAFLCLRAVTAIRPPAACSVSIQRTAPSICGSRFAARPTPR